jgi:2-methylcitrate dehydratase PrpD
VSEWKKSSGKELVVAIVLAHEIAQRIATGFVAAKKIVKKTSQKDIILYPPIPGYGANVFGGVAGVSKILGLTKDKVEHAMGIGGYMCPIPTLIQFAESVPSSMSKYSPSGWISQAGLTAALLSEMGYTGDKNILDGEFGFWRSFGADGWRPEVVVQGLGVRWYLPEMISYKRYPCCGAMHAALDILNAIINQYDLYPEDIKELNVVLNLLAEFNLWKNREIKTHIEAQFSPAYVFSLACHRIETGYQWQIPQTYKDRNILGFMNKINIFTPASPEYTNKEHVVEVILYDKQTGREKTYTENDVLPVGFSINDEELYAKFRHNAKELLPPRKTEQLLQNVLNVDYLDDISRLMEPFKML